MYSDCLFLLDSVLEGFTFLEICSFFIGGPICWHIAAHYILLLIFCISVVSVVIFPLSFFILFIQFFSYFFLLSLAKGYPFYFSKTPALDFTGLLYCFFGPYFISSFILFTLTFIIFFLHMTFKVSDSFSNSFKQ